ncbi:MAG: hypothetical protein M3Y77_22620 [Actinomycetota bacterium]|nr:hypothetical protein [Actinomycetota bacterium]
MSNTSTGDGLSPLIVLVFHMQPSLAELFSVARFTVYSTVQRAGEPNVAPPRS